MRQDVDHALHGLRHPVHDDAIFAFGYHVHAQLGARGLDHDADVAGVFLRFDATAALHDLDARVAASAVVHPRVTDQPLMSLRRKLATPFDELARRVEHLLIFGRELLAVLI
jgi:hypothetical protein